MAARLDPARVPSLHQALHHFVATAAWRDDTMLAAVREQVLPALIRHGPITAWIIDDTGFPKKGRHSVGVARQYCGQLGKQENCQVAVSLSVTNEQASLPIAFELYLPEDWAGDPARRAKAGVPQDLAFRTMIGSADHPFRRIGAARAAPKGRRSRWSRSAALWRMACRPGSSWGMRAMASTPTFVPP
jgi:SRSO17 transposase